MARQFLNFTAIAGRAKKRLLHRRWQLPFFRLAMLRFRGNRQACLLLVRKAPQLGSTAQAVVHELLTSQARRALQTCWQCSRLFATQQIGFNPACISFTKRAVSKSVTNCQSILICPKLLVAAGRLSRVLTSSVLIDPDLAALVPKPRVNLTRYRGFSHPRGNVRPH